MNNFKSKPNHEMGQSSATLTSPLSMTPDMHFLITVQCFYLVQYSTHRNIRPRMRAPILFQVNK